MSDPMAVQTTDEVDVLLRSERRRQGRERLGLMVMVAGILSAGLVLMLGDAGALSDGETSLGLMVAAGLGLVGALTTLWWKRGRAANRLEALIGRRDRLQRGRSDRIFATSLSGWAMVAACLPALFRIAQGQPDDHDLGFVAGALLAPWAVVISVAGWGGMLRVNRRWLEDEVTRDIRQRALSLGFLVLLAGVSGLFVLGLWRPVWAIAAFFPVLMSAASVVGLRYVWLDQEAEGRGDG